MKCALVHISDLHIADDTELISSEDFSNFTNRLKNIISGCDSAIFTISGDLTDTGKQTQFQRVGDVIDRTPIYRPVCNGQLSLTL